MRCRTNRSLILSLVFLTCLSARADFNDATKAYLLGDFQNARYEALVAATDGMPEAQMLLGQLYFNGEGVEKDIKIALYWYEKAATQGFPDAQYRLGTLYYEGKHDIPKNYNQAYHWLNKSLQNGNKKAQTILEGLYELEDGNVVNLEESLDKLQEIASKGNKQARYLYSQRLLKGTGFPEDKAKAVAILTEDAKQGFVKAQKRLGELYFYGDGVTQDYYEAYAWSMAYAGTRELGGLAREGKQTARSALRKLDDEKHHDAYLRSKEYFERYVLPFHSNAREVGPEKYRIVVRSRKAQLAQSQKQNQAQKQKSADMLKQQSSTILKNSDVVLCEKIANNSKTPQRTKQDVAPVFEHHQNDIYAIYDLELKKDPGLRGKLVYEIEINPAGKVTRVNKRAESTIKATGFETSLVKRIKEIDFCKKGTMPFVVAFPIDFIPNKNTSAKNLDPALERTKAAVARSQQGGSKQEKVLDKLALTVDPNMSTAIEPKTVNLPSTPAKSSVSTLTNETAQRTGNQQTTSLERDAPMESSSGVKTSPEAKSSGTAASGETIAGAQVKNEIPSESLKTENAEQDPEKRNYREIHNVFIRHRSRLNAIYQRAYSQDNNLRGRVVFNLSIDPEGKVTKAGVSSSDLDSPALEQELIDYIKDIKFTRKNTDNFDISYPLDFLP